MLDAAEAAAIATRINMIETNSSPRVAHVVCNVIGPKIADAASRGERAVMDVVGDKDLVNDVVAALASLGYGVQPTTLTTLHISW